MVVHEVRIRRSACARDCPGAKPGEPAPEHVLQFIVEDLRTRLQQGSTDWFRGRLTPAFLALSFLRI